MKLSAGKLWGLRRMADKAGRFKMTAVDQRPPIKNPIKEKRGAVSAPWEDVARFKALLIEELQQGSSAMLLDPHYAYPKAISLFDPRRGLILTLEDSCFEEGPEGRVSGEIDHWSVEKIKRVGGDAVKVLAWYRPDAGRRILARQQDFVARVGEACLKYDIPFVFELLVYPLVSDAERTSDYIEMKTKKPELVVQSVQTFADPKFGVDLFKLESPLAAGDVPGVGAPEWSTAQSWFDELGKAAARPWVMLSAGAGMLAFRNVLTHAYQAGASGYLAGRAIWLEAFAHFPDWQGIRKDLRGNAREYMRAINELTDAEALPWHRHPSAEEWGTGVHPADGSFRRHYEGFGDSP